MRRESQAFSDGDDIRLAETRKHVLLKSNQDCTTIYESPYLPVKGRGGKRLLNEKKQIRSRLMEAYFETNRNELEVCCILPFSYWKTSEV